MFAYHKKYLFLEAFEKNLHVGEATLNLHKLTL